MQVLPELAELSFVRAVASGTVHIVVSVPTWAEPEEPPAMSMAEGLAKLAAGELATTVLCGRQAELAGTRYEPVGRFADEDLCRACHRALPAAEQWRAFQHDTPA